jgi:hypothetical protein
MTKKLIKETKSIDSYSFEGKLEDIIEMLQDWEKEGGWEGIEIYDYNDCQLYKHREETDAEVERRTKAEEYDKERRRKEYEKLRKEFEDTP